MQEFGSLVPGGHVDCESTKLKSEKIENFHIFVLSLLEERRKMNAGEFFSQNFINMLIFFLVEMLS